MVSIVWCSCSWVFCGRFLFVWLIRVWWNLDVSICNEAVSSLVLLLMLVLRCVANRVMSKSLLSMFRIVCLYICMSCR